MSGSALSAHNISGILVEVAFNVFKNKLAEVKTAA